MRFLSLVLDPAQTSMTTRSLMRIRAAVTGCRTWPLSRPERAGPCARTF